MFLDYAVEPLYYERGMDFYQGDKTTHWHLCYTRWGRRFSGHTLSTVCWQVSSAQ